MKAKHSRLISAVLGVALIFLGIGMVSGRLRLAVINVYNPNVVPAIIKVDPSGSESAPTIKAPGSAYKPYVEFNVSTGQFDIQSSVDVSYCAISGIGNTPIYPSYAIGESGFKAVVLLWSNGAPSSGTYKLSFHVVVKRLTDNKLFTFDVSGWVKFERASFTWYINNVQVSGKGEYEVINIPGPTLTFKAVPSGDVSQVSKVYVKIWKPHAGFDPPQVKSMFPADYTVDLAKQADGSYIGSWTASYGTYIIYGFYQMGGSEFQALSLIYSWSEEGGGIQIDVWTYIGVALIAIGVLLILRVA